MAQHFLFWWDSNWPLVISLITISIVGSLIGASVGAYLGAHLAAKRERNRERITMTVEIWWSFHKLALELRSEVIYDLRRLTDHVPNADLMEAHSAVSLRFSKAGSPIFHTYLMIKHYLPKLEETAGKVVLSYNECLSAMLKLAKPNHADWSTDRVRIRELLAQVDKSLTSLEDELAALMLPSPGSVTPPSNS